MAVPPIDHSTHQNFTNLSKKKRTPWQSTVEKQIVDSPQLEVVPGSPLKEKKFHSKHRLTLLASELPDLSDLIQGIDISEDHPWKGGKEEGKMDASSKAESSAAPELEQTMVELLDQSFEDWDAESPKKAEE